LFLIKNEKMKKILIALICLVFIKAGLNAQATFDTCQYANRFNGEWMYANGNDTIRVFLRAQRNYYTEFKTVQDMILGWHEYKQGNTIIESTYPNRFMTIYNVDTLTYNSVSIGLKSLGAHCNSGIMTASGTITDYLQDKQGKIVTVTLNAAGNVITWKQWHKANNGMFGRPSGMTLPSEFILLKQ